MLTRREAAASAGRASRPSRGRQPQADASGANVSDALAALWRERKRPPPDARRARLVAEDRPRSSPRPRGPEAPGLRGIGRARASGSAISHPADKQHIHTCAPVGATMRILKKRALRAEGARSARAVSLSAGAGEANQRQGAQRGRPNAGLSVAGRQRTDKMRQLAGGGARRTPASAF